MQQFSYQGLTVVQEVVDLERRVAVGDAAEVLEPTHRGAEGAAPRATHQVHDGAAGGRVHHVLARVVDLKSKTSTVRGVPGINVTKLLFLIFCLGLQNCILTLFD